MHRPSNRLSLLLVLTCIAVGCGPEIGPEAPPPAWPAPDEDPAPPAAEAGRHDVFLWTWDEDRASPGFADAARDLGANGVQVPSYRDPAPLAAAGLDWYEDETAGKGTLYLRDTQYKPVWDAFWEERDERWPASRARPVCLRDPELLAAMAARTATAAERAVAPLVREDGEARDGEDRDGEDRDGEVRGRARFLVLADEPSMTVRANPLDWCLDDRCVEAFRGAMRDRWGGDLDALNGAWATEYASWDDVVPWTTAAIRKRAYATSPDAWNLAPWMETRAFQDRTFADTLATLRSVARRAAPDVPCGIAGTQAPSAFGGWDYLRLTAACDFLEPYDIGLALPIVRDLAGPDTVIAQTVFPTDDVRVSRWRLWRSVLRGAGVSIVWSSRDVWSAQGDGRFVPLAYGAAITPELERLSEPGGVGGRLAHATPLDEGIRILVSQPSIAVRWMMDSREDGDTWPRRFGSYEARHSTAIRSRERAWRGLADRNARFVDARTLHDGALDADVELVVLPDALALSDAEVAALRSFVERGGRLVADVAPGQFDELGRARAAPPLADISGRKGGEALLLLDGFERLSEQASHVCGPPPVSVSATDASGDDVGVETELRRHGQDLYVIAVGAWQIDIESTGETNDRLPEGGVALKFRFSDGQARTVHDEMERADLGEVTTWKTSIDAGGAAIFRIR